MAHRRTGIVGLILSALCLLAACQDSSTRSNVPGSLIVSAAADLTPAFQTLGQQFEQQTGIKVTFNFGSTGQLAQQIEHGAPIDLFAAANVSFVEELERKISSSPTRKLSTRGDALRSGRAPIARTD
jgi:molybdate transport system substrate-binding protein